MSKIDVDVIPWEVIGDVYRNMGIDIDDDDEVERANRMISNFTPSQFLDKFLAYNGVHGYGARVWEVCSALNDAMIKDEV